MKRSMFVLLTAALFTTLTGCEQKPGEPSKDGSQTNDATPAGDKDGAKPADAKDGKGDEKKNPDAKDTAGDEKKSADAKDGTDDKEEAKAADGKDAAGYEKKSPDAKPEEAPKATN